MEFKVIWSDQAIADLHDTCSFLAQDDPQAAARLGKSILEHVRILEGFPFNRPDLSSGYGWPLAGDRIPFLSYILRRI